MRADGVIFVFLGGGRFNARSGRHDGWETSRWVRKGIDSKAQQQASTSHSKNNRCFGPLESSRSLLHPIDLELLPHLVRTWYILLFLCPRMPRSIEGSRLVQRMDWPTRRHRIRNMSRGHSRGSSKHTGFYHIQTVLS